MNIDEKLLKLAAEHKARLGSLSRGNKARRCFIRGQADKLIRNAYPLNYDSVRSEWDKLAR